MSKVVGGAGGIRNNRSSVTRAIASPNAQLPKIWVKLAFNQDKLGYAAEKDKKTQ